MQKIKKIGIIHLSNFSFTMIVTNILEEYLEEYCIPTVGVISTMDPVTLIDENIESLIIGDMIEDDHPNQRLISWLKHFSDLSSQSHQKLNLIAVYCIGEPTENYELELKLFFQKYFASVFIYSPNLYINIADSRVSLEEHLVPKIKRFSSEIISKILISS